MKEKIDLTYPAMQINNLEKMLYHDLSRLHPDRGYAPKGEDFLILERAIKLAQLISHLNEIDWYSFDGYEEVKEEE